MYILSRKQLQKTKLWKIALENRGRYFIIAADGYWSFQSLGTAWSFLVYLKDKESMYD